MKRIGAMVSVVLLAGACSSGASSTSKSLATTPVVTAQPAATAAPVDTAAPEPTSPPETQPSLPVAPVAVKDTCPASATVGLECWTVAVPIDPAVEDGPTFDLGVTTAALIRTRGIHRCYS